ncbi:hypothetical protein [Streptomyces venezuelae]|uniref:hypothetical protein n=1 Tax=Streptomyces venezuelae TaxID=54571 RepID=UPI0029588C2A|nr:hypothetical protein [Streptomyces venezuelae]
MVRAGQSSERAQLIYQHSTREHQRRLAADIDATVRLQRVPADRGLRGQVPGATRASVSPLPSPTPGRTSRAR